LPRDIEALVAAYGRLNPPDRERLLARAVELADWTDPPNSVVTGTIWYRERIAMPSDAVVVATVERVHNGATELVAEQRIDQPGNVPVPFQVPFAHDAIDPANHYALRAHIAAGSHVRWMTQAPVPVITYGAPSRLDVMVVRVPAAVG
jgi:putative lipoprotein